MENRPDPPPWGKGHVIRPVGAAVAPRGLVYQASEATSQRLRELAAENGIGDLDFVKLGVALAEILTVAKREGNHLAVVDPEGKLVQDVVGL